MIHLITTPLYPLHTEQDYDKAILILNALLDAGGANENNPLARLVVAKRFYWQL
jgi:hypothetical protein